MRWLDGIISDSMDMSLSKFREIVKDKEARCASVHGITNSRIWLSNWTTITTEQHSTYQNLEQLCYLSPPPECRLHVCRGSFFLVLLYTSALGQAWFIQNIPLIIDSWAHSSHVTVLDVEGKQFLAAAAAAAKSLQSCPTLCDPIDGSPPGFPVPGILQARTLEWVAISFSNAWKWKVKVKLLSHVRLSATPWTAAYQAPPSMGFSRQKYWSGVSNSLASDNISKIASLTVPVAWQEETNSKVYKWISKIISNKDKCHLENKKKKEKENKT